MPFELVSSYQPMGDQPAAISALVKGLNEGEPAQVLLGVTGSGKTFSVANIIAEVQRPTLILSHNKTLAAQLYGEFKQFFPNNAVEYFISYYDYYQPEAYIASTNTYIEKDLSINQEIEKLRLSATSALVSGRRDVIVIASVSCIYGIGNPEEFAKNVVRLTVGDVLERRKFLLSLSDILYSRTRDHDFRRGTFRVKGDTVDVFPAYADFAWRIDFFGDEVERITMINPEDGKKIGEEKFVTIYAANLFVTGRDALEQAIDQISDELDHQIKHFEMEGRPAEAQRIKERTEFDIDMMRELGYCSGIENYSRFFDRRQPGTRPFCLIDYFPPDALLVIDESHVTIPQIRAMWGGDRSRKVSLVEYGFRLPSALDNRPLNFNEFEDLLGQTLFVSATPGDYELRRSEGVVVEQIIRPTGLLDPVIELRPTKNQIDNLLDEIHARIAQNERIMITTLTKRMAEELSRFFDRVSVKAQYIHSDVKSLDRVEILRNFRLGEFDVLVGVNLLREGLDLPEVSLVCIMDADKEGFLRDVRSLIQIMGRAARNENGKVLLYGDKITNSMRQAIDETNRRRARQMEYNEQYGITPKTVRKSHHEILAQTKVADSRVAARVQALYDIEQEQNSLNLLAADPVMAYMSKNDLQKQADLLRREMEKAAKDLDFMTAAKLRDQWLAIQDRLKTQAT